MSAYYKVEVLNDFAPSEYEVVTDLEAFRTRLLNERGHLNYLVVAEFADKNGTPPPPPPSRFDRAEVV